MPIEPKMNDPDWGRYVMSSGRKVMPSGVPTRWAGHVRMDFAMEPRILVSPMFIQVACADDYSRGWSITGVLTLPTSAWEADGSYPIPPPGIGINVLIEIFTGLSQVQMTQQILLMCGNDPTRGLCNQQAAVNGGPYGQMTAQPGGFPFSSYLSRPFAAVHALVGNTIGIRAIIEQGDTVAEYNPLFLTLMVAPVAAGEGV